MLINKATPVEQLDCSLEAEDGVALQQLLLLLWHVACPLTHLCILCPLCPGKELKPLLHLPQVLCLGLVFHLDVAQCCQTACR